MKKLCLEGVANECILIQTCNRVEIYSVLKNSAERDSVGAILKFWSINTGVSLDILTKNVDLFKGREALLHLFNITCGLDSMAVGEDQILGQVRTAYTSAKKIESVGLVLDRVFMCAINAGKKVRSGTRINHGSISISSAAVDFAAKELGDLKQKTVLIVGAGEAGSVAAETLRRRGVKSIIIANRTYETGVHLAKKVLGKAIRFEKIHKVMSRTDVTIVALSVDKPIIKASSLREAYSSHSALRRSLIIDISQPRAVEEEVGSMHGVILRNIDNLKEVIEESIKYRQTEAEKARKIMLKELERFERHQSKFLIQPLISEIYRRVDSVRQHELKRALNKMKECDEKKVEILNRFSRELVERILQVPIDQLRQAALDSDSDLLSSAKKLFKIKQV